MCVYLCAEINGSQSTSMQEGKRIMFDKDREEK